MSGVEMVVDESIERGDDEEVTTTTTTIASDTIGEDAGKAEPANTSPPDRDATEPPADPAGKAELALGRESLAACVDAMHAMMRTLEETRLSFVAAMRQEQEKSLALELAGAQRHLKGVEEDLDGARREVQRHEERKAEATRAVRNLERDMRRLASSQPVPAPAVQHPPHAGAVQAAAAVAPPPGNAASAADVAELRELAALSDAAFQELKDEADRKQPVGASGYRGVDKKGKGKRWQARLYHWGDLVTCGYFDDAGSAARAYDRMALRLKGASAGCKLNFHPRNYLSPGGALLPGDGAGDAGHREPRVKKRKVSPNTTNLHLIIAKPKGKECPGKEWQIYTPARSIVC